MIPARRTSRTKKSQEWGRNKPSSSYQSSGYVYKMVPDNSLLRWSLTTACDALAVSLDKELS